MPKVSSAQEVTDLLRAKYPLIYLSSAEEDRVLEALVDIAKDLGRALKVWSVTKGFRVLVRGADDHELKANQPSLALDLVEKSNADQIVVLLDFGVFTEKDPVVVRALRDCVSAFANGKHKRSLVVLSPAAKIPTELEKIATLVDWDLPDRNEIQQISGQYAKAYQIQEVNPDSVDAAVGLTKDQVHNAFAYSLARTSRMTGIPALDPVIIQAEKEGLIKKSGLVEFIKTDIDISQVGGLGNLKKWLASRRNAFTQKAREFRLPQPKGLVVVGCPGTGKTMIGKAVGNAWGMPLVKFDIGRVFAGIVGSSEENMRRSLKLFEAIAPCVVLIDEVEKGLSGTGSSGATDGGTTARVFGTMLTWLNDKEAPVFVIATANDVTSLPPELLRKGRMDEVFFSDLPDSDERSAIFDIHIRKVGRHTEQIVSARELGELASATEGYSGAEIEQVVAAGLYLAFERETDLDYRSLREAIGQVVPLSRTAADKIEALRDWARGKAVFAGDRQDRPAALSGRFAP